MFAVESEKEQSKKLTKGIRLYDETIIFAEFFLLLTNCERRAIISDIHKRNKWSKIMEKKYDDKKMLRKIQFRLNQNNLTKMPVQTYDF